MLEVNRSLLKLYCCVMIFIVPAMFIKALEQSLRFGVMVRALVVTVIGYV